MEDYWKGRSDFGKGNFDLNVRWIAFNMSQKYAIRNATGALVGEAGAAWPYRMVTGIFEYLQASFPERFSLASNTPVQSIRRTMDVQHPYSITTTRGIMRATHISHCTEGHAAHLLPQLRGILVPRRGQMTVQNASHLVSKDKLQSWSWNMQGVFDYATINAQTGLVYIGGGDENRKEHSLGVSSDAEEDLAALSHLGGVLHAAFAPGNLASERPRNTYVQASWTGILGHSMDQVPLVGMLPQELLDRPVGSSTAAEWIAAGYGGYGMVNAFLCGKAVALMMLGMQQHVDLPQAYLLTQSRANSLLSKLRRTRSWKDHIQAML